MKQFRLLTLSQHPWRWAALLGIVALAVFVSPRFAVGELIGRESIDYILGGDDPAASLSIVLSANASVPSTVHFDGFSENLDFAGDTAVRYRLLWWPPGSDVFQGDIIPNLGGRLPKNDPILGPTRMDIHFRQQFDFIPSKVEFIAEGLGPNDDFRFAGELTVYQVPEPSSLGLLATAAAATVVIRLCRVPRGARPRCATRSASAMENRVTQAACDEPSVHHPPIVAIHES